jgi:enoyl-CoA hydratase/carnithine racemase
MIDTVCNLVILVNDCYARPEGEESEMTEPGKHWTGIDVDQRGRVLLARIDGGPRAEFSREIAADLSELVTRATADEGVGAVVLTGTHPTRFIGHAEVGWLKELGAASRPIGRRAASVVLRAAGAGRRTPGVRHIIERSRLGDAVGYLSFHDTMLQMNTSGAAFVAALNGSALGAGSELALACDYRFMADGDHVIGQPEILLGFPPGGGGTQRLSRLVGTHRAMTMMLEGAGLDPQSAAQIGYIDEVVDPDSLIERAVAHADRLARRVKDAVAAVKRSAYLGGSQTLERGLHLERAEFLSSIGQPGAQQAMAAYIEQTAVLDDLPAYDKDTFARMRADGTSGLGSDIAGTNASPPT